MEDKCKYEFMSMFADNCVEPNYRVKSYSNMIAAVPIKQTNYNSNMRSTIGTYFGLNKGIALLYSVITGADRELFILNKEENLCPNCHGLGSVKQLDLNKMVDFNTPLYKNPFRCWDRYKEFYAQIIEKFCGDSKIDSKKTFRDLNDKEIQTLLYGESTQKYSIKYKKVNRLASRTTKYYGVCTDHPMMPEFTVSKKYYSDVECPVCNGKRYSSINDAFKLNGLTIGQFMTTPFIDLIDIIKTSKIYNYKGVKLSIGENALNLVHGKSGIGKSTLLREYFPQIFENYSYINQKPLYGNKTSSVATLLDIFGKTTDVFAKKFKKGKTFFSNQKGCEGACPSCGGTGYLEYTSDGDNKILIECKDCHSTGFHPQLKKYAINDKTLFDICNS